MTPVLIFTFCCFTMLMSACVHFFYLFWQRFNIYLPSLLHVLAFLFHTSISLCYILGNFLSSLSNYISLFSSVSNLHLDSSFEKLFPLPSLYVIFWPLLCSFLILSIHLSYCSNLAFKVSGSSFIFLDIWLCYHL